MNLDFRFAYVCLLVWRAIKEIEEQQTSLLTLNRGNSLYDS